MRDRGFGQGHFDKPRRAGVADIHAAKDFKPVFFNFCVAIWPFYRSVQVVAPILFNCLQGLSGQFRLPRRRDNRPVAADNQ